MNVSGFLVVYFMSLTMKQPNNNAVRKSQSDWFKLMPKKLLMSLTLTPITDRFLMAFFGGGQTKKSDLGDDQVDSHGLTSTQKLESVEQLIIFFKFCMVLAIYVYSCYMKYFRE